MDKTLSPFDETKLASVEASVSKKKSTARKKEIDVRNVKFEHKIDRINLQLHKTSLWTPPKSGILGSVCDPTEKSVMVLQIQ